MVGPVYSIIIVSLHRQTYIASPSSLNDQSREGRVEPIQDQCELSPESLHSIPEQVQQAHVHIMTLH